MLVYNGKKIDSGQKGCHVKVHLKSSRMVQTPVRSYGCGSTFDQNALLYSMVFFIHVPMHVRVYISVLHSGKIVNMNILYTYRHTHGTHTVITI